MNRRVGGHTRQASDPRVGARPSAGPAYGPVTILDARGRVVRVIPVEAVQAIARQEEATRSRRYPT